MSKTKASARCTSTIRCAPLPYLSYISPLATIKAEMTITDVYKDYNILLIHGTKLNGGAGGNKCIPQNSDIPTRMRFTTQTSTTICCSSFQKGERLKNIFAPTGLILLSGDIIAADEFDLGSWINDDCNREYDLSTQPIEEQIQGAIDNKTLWNEFIVANHTELGIYLCLDDTHYLFNEIGRFRDFVDNTSDLGLPCFGIQSGEFYLLEFDFNHNNFKLTEKLSVKEIKKRFCNNG